MSTFRLPRLYRIGANGKISAWEISFDGENLVMRWGQFEGFDQGKFRESRRRVIPKGSLNVYEQARSEAESRWKRKKDRDGYSEELPGKAETLLIDMPAMLGNRWEPDQTETQIRRWPVWVEEKLDGIRCRAYRNPDGTILLKSRTNLTFNHLNHIREDLRQFFPYLESILRERVPDVGNNYFIDGELYSQELTFDRINGISRLSAGSPPDPHETLIKYYMFDLAMPGDRTYDERWWLLYTAFQEFVKKYPESNLKIIIPLIANSKEDILKAHQYYIDQGYEGVIIRKIDGKTQAERKESYYVTRRSNAILKYKTFEDEEGEIIGAEEGTGTEKGAVVWVVKSPNGATFSVRPRGSIETRKEYYQAWLKNPRQFIGLKYRYRFQERTPEGKPRFPVGVGFVFDR